MLSVSYLRQVIQIDKILCDEALAPCRSVVGFRFSSGGRSATFRPFVRPSQHPRTSAQTASDCMGTCENYILQTFRPRVPAANSRPHLLNSDAFRLPQLFVSASHSSLFGLSLHICHQESSKLRHPLLSFLAPLRVVDALHFVTLCVALVLPLAIAVQLATFSLLSSLAEAVCYHPYSR